MSVEYLDSQHNLVCNHCGTVFCVNIGDIYLRANRAARPDKFRVYCPKCNRQARVESFVARERGYYEKDRPYERFHENHSIRLPENINAQDSINSLLAEIRAMTRQLFCLRRCALHVINQWREKYNGSILHPEMTELQRTIKEIDGTNPESTINACLHDDPHEKDP